MNNDISEVSPIELPCTEGFIHIFKYAIPGEVEERNFLQLSENERKRAEAYKDLADRNRFCIARLFLRGILARYIHVEASNISFEYSPLYNKPLLDKEGIQFNLSYRGDWAVLAVSDKMIGVDIEKQIKIYDIDQFAKNFFSVAERQWLSSSAGEKEKQNNFFKLWTLKEAYIKAIGKGFSFPLQDFSIHVNDHKQIGLELPSGADDQWQFLELEAPKNYSAAVCYKR